MSSRRETAEERKRRLLEQLKHRPKPRLVDIRFSLRAMLIGIAACAAIFAAVRYYNVVSRPRATVFCDKPNARLYCRDRFLGATPVVFTEDRMRSLFPNYDDTIRGWYPRRIHKKPEEDLRGFVSNECTNGRAFWFELEPTDAQQYHYRETPWGRAIGGGGGTGHRDGVTVHVSPRTPASTEFVQSWQVSDQPVAPGARCVANIELGRKVAADSINKQWSVRVHYRSYEGKARRRLKDPDTAVFEPSASPNDNSHFVHFDAPTEPGQYIVSLWLYAIPTDPRNNHPAADLEMLSVSESAPAR